jgi:hypothetical protein
VVPFPDPLRGSQLFFDVNLLGFADSLRFKIFTPAMVETQATRVQGSFFPGWNVVGIGLNGALPRGIYLVTVEGQEGDLTARLASPARFFYWP